MNKRKIKRKKERKKERKNERKNLGKRTKKSQSERFSSGLLLFSLRFFAWSWNSLYWPFQRNTIVTNQNVSRFPGAIPLWFTTTNNVDVGTGLLARPFARTAHLFARSVLFAQFARSAAHSFAHSLTPELVGMRIIRGQGIRLFEPCCGAAPSNRIARWRQREGDARRVFSR